MTMMNSIVLQNGVLNVIQTPLPQPQAGQVLVRSLACGICGSDLHITRHSDDVLNLFRDLDLLPPGTDNHAQVMLGHEFCAEIISYGPNSQENLPIGSRVTSVPILLSQNNAGVGVTPGIGGAYSEYFILDEALLLPIPKHIPDEAAALTEPLAVGLHAVNRANIGSNDTALVVGCGPIGLAVISALHRKGVQQILAADLQQDKLMLARKFGATAHINPKEQDEVAVAASYTNSNRLVIFECVGIHRLIDSFVHRAPTNATVVVTGVHTTPSTINYAYATVKELDICFSYYYQPDEFKECLDAIADGEIPWPLLLTGKVGIDGVSDAFAQLMKPNKHIKVVVEPWRKGKLEAY